MEIPYTNMANDHCSVNCCTNDKRNESGKDLSFFNFPSNETQRSQWIAAIKRDEGPHFEVSVTCDEPRPARCQTQEFYLLPILKIFKFKTQLARSLFMK